MSEYVGFQRRLCLVLYSSEESLKVDWQEYQKCEIVQVKNMGEKYSVRC